MTALLDSLIAQYEECERRRNARKLEECPPRANCKRCLRGRQLRGAIKRGERSE